MLQRTYVSHRSGCLLLLASVMLALLLFTNATAQTTAFSYQGRLDDNGNPANGQYDFKFKLFDTATIDTGSQQGAIFSVTNLTVTAGTFTVLLDFGSAVFPGAARFLEIAVKKSSDPTFTTLSPRQAVAANPYAIHTLNADGLSVACVSCITSSQIQSVQGSQVTGNIAASQISGAIPVASIPAGSTNYIQNSASPLAAPSFNIGGNGTAAGTLSGNVVNAGTQFNIGGTRMLSNPGASNLFAGESAGTANTSGFQNVFVGTEAGAANTTGRDNAFFGQRSGLANTTGEFNAFFGSSAGQLNTTGIDNSFFGFGAGTFNTTGNDNSFFGLLAGFSNTTANSNSFFGSQAGTANTTGAENSFFGSAAGLSNTVACCNSFFGFSAGALSTASNNTFFGAEAGKRNTTGSFNTFFEHAAGADTTIGGGNTFFGDLAGLSNTTSNGNTFIGAGAGEFSTSATGGNTLLGADADIFTDTDIKESTAIGFQAVITTSNTIVLGRSLETVRIPGSLNVTGTKNFKIDHPLDPENKYLYHAAIESSEVLNIYSGNVTTDQDGIAVVTLPDWFEAINRDFRYQLTVIGAFAQTIVAEKIKHNRFSIKTSVPNVEVSWQVTGIRSDPGLLKHPFKVEEDKPESERGRYLSPEGYGQPEERGVEWVGSPERLERLKQRRTAAERSRN